MRVKVNNRSFSSLVKQFQYIYQASFYPESGGEEHDVILNVHKCMNIKKISSLTHPLFFLHHLRKQRRKGAKRLKGKGETLQEQVTILPCFDPMGWHMDAMMGNDNLWFDKIVNEPPDRKGIDHLIIIASKIMYVVQQSITAYPNFLGSNCSKLWSHDILTWLSTYQDGLQRKS